MKQGLIYGCFFLVLSCAGSSEDSGAEIQPWTPDKTQKVDPLIGMWRMDSSVFIHSGVNGIYTPPIAPTTWTFEEDGDYLVKNTMELNGTFARSDDSVFVTLMGVDNAYEIISLTDTYMTLRSTIYDLDTSDLKTEAYLTRISN